MKRRRPEAVRPGAAAGRRHRVAQPDDADAFAGPLAPTLSDTARAQEWDVSLELAVRDNRSLSDASAEAIRATRSLGGFVVSSNVATQGSGGRADLVLRIPQRRVQDAIAQFSELGTITGQQVTVQDRQADLDRLAKRIDTLRIQLAEVRAQLAQGGLSEADRLRLELRRQRLQGELNQQTRQRTGIANEVALAEFSLTLQTKRAAAAAGDSRIDGAVGDAVEVLSVAAAVGLFLLIVLAPLAVIAAAALPRPALVPPPRGGATARPASPDADQLVSARARGGLDAEQDPARRDGADLHRLLARLVVRAARAATRTSRAIGGASSSA